MTLVVDRISGQEKKHWELPLSGWTQVDTGSGDRRRFRVRRLDAFARWLLSFAGDARPVAPQSLADLYAEQVARTRAELATLIDTSIYREAQALRAAR